MFLEENEEYVLVRKRWFCNHHNRILYHHNPCMKVQNRLCWYDINCRWNALRSCRHPFGSKKTYSRTLNEIHSDSEIWDPEFKMYLPMEQNSRWWKFSSVYKSFKNIFRCPCENNMRGWGIRKKHTPERDRRSRSVYIYLLLRCRLDFLTELFSKNVTFGARVCPPVGTGD